MATATIPDDWVDQIYEKGSAIPLVAFQTCIAITFGLAIICALARSVMRFLTRRPLYWDDFFLAVAVACLITVTGIIYSNQFYIFMLGAITIDPKSYGIIPIPEIKYLLASSVPQQSAAAGIAWTTVFCVKASFLIISRQLISRTTWLTYYFWAVAIFTGLGWATLVASPFIQCSHFGEASSQCSGPRQETIWVAMNSLIAFLDISTDILVASIPIMVLWRSKIDKKQKLIIGPFLSLSLLLIIFSSIRVSRSQATSKPDVVWLAFWQYLEAAIAVIVTSITTLRTVFTARKARKTQQSASSNPYGGTTNVRGKTGRNTPGVGGTLGMLGGLGTLSTFKQIDDDDDSHPMVNVADSQSSDVSGKGIGVNVEVGKIRVQESWDVSFSDPHRQRSEVDLGEIGVGR